MAGELVKYQQPQPPAKPTRRSTVRQELQRSAEQVEAQMALAAYIIDGAVVLDHYRQSRTQGDAMVDVFLCNVEATAFRNCERIQNRMGSGF